MINFLSFILGLIIYLSISAFIIWFAIGCVKLYFDDIKTKKQFLLWLIPGGPLYIKFKQLQ